MSCELLKKNLTLFLSFSFGEFPLYLLQSYFGVSFVCHTFHLFSSLFLCPITLMKLMQSGFCTLEIFLKH